MTRSRIVPDFPRGSLPGPSGRIYVVQFNDGAVKVGRSLDVRSRVRALVWDPFRTGIAIVNGWCSEPHDDWETNEMRLILFCRDRFGEPRQRTSETFDADYETVRAYASCLTSAANAA